jgi:hypothetical protein
VEKIPPMTKGGSMLAPSRIQSASDGFFPIAYFEYFYDKVSHKN